MRRVAVLGSTGSIGENALRVVEAAPSEFRIVGLAAGRNHGRLSEQISRHRPPIAAVCAGEGEPLCAMLEEAPAEVVTGEEGMVRVATMEEADIVLIAISGAAALAPAFAAVQAGKTVALANKECLVMAGELILETAAKTGAIVLPVDSEHSGVFQALAGRPVGQVRRIILPASGGPFLDTPLAEIEKATPEMALNHPTWNMGKRISIDSATLMNKALEVIEARWLFNVPPERVDVVIHPESVIHGIVEFVDGSMVAQMSVPDMRLPILRALSWPGRMDAGLPRLDLAAFGRLTFREVDHKKFPALGLAYKALETGGTAPAVLAAADEEAVAAFLDNKIPFGRLVPAIAEVLAEHKPQPADSIARVIEADHWAREKTRDLIDKA